MDNKLLRLLEFEAEKLADEYKQASVEGCGTPQEVADRREGYFADFLKSTFHFHIWPDTVMTYDDLNNFLVNAGL